MDDFDIINIDGFKMQEIYAVNKINHVMKFLLKSDYAYKQYLFSTKILMEDGYSIDDAIKIWYVMYDSDLPFVDDLLCKPRNSYEIGKYIYKLYEYINKNICQTTNCITFEKTVIKLLLWDEHESE